MHRLQGFLEHDFKQLNDPVSQFFNWAHVLIKVIFVQFGNVKVKANSELSKGVTKEQAYKVSQL